MSLNIATATWEGDLMHGSGHIAARSKAFDVPFSLKSRIENTPQTNPEELIGAAHAGCYSMMTSALLTQAGTPPTSIKTVARVHQEQVEGAFVITRIELETEARVPGIDEAKYLEVANNAKANCPVSKALAGVKIELKATFLGN